MIITATEIIETLPIGKEFPPQYFNNSIINKQELLLANQFLGETFYTEILQDKTDTGEFDTAKYQTLYDNYLRTLISESILLSVCIQLALNFDNIGLSQLNANHAQPLSKELINTYKDELNKQVDSSKLLIHSFLTNPVNVADYQNYLGNGTITQETSDTNPKTFNGYSFDLD